MTDNLIRPLTTRRAAIVAESTEKTQELAKLQAELTALQLEKRHIDGLLEHYGHGLPDGAAPGPESKREGVTTTEADVDFGGGSGLSDAIIEIVEKYPGIETKDLYDRGVASGISTASDPRHSVANLSRRMRRQGKLMHANGRWYPAGWNDSGVIDG